MPDFSHEMRHRHGPDRPVCGVDEAGRGPLAGPVVAAAVVLPCGALPGWCAAIDDSKALSAARRAALYDAITGDPALAGRFAVGVADVAEIDRINILQATFLAMERAVAGLGVRPAVVLVDGNRPPRLDGVPGGRPAEVHCLVDGDALCLSIAAASILAKVTRDRIMADLARRWPGYGWESNAGYGTPAHLEAIRRLGPCPEHRRSFAPIAQASLAL